MWTSIIQTLNSVKVHAHQTRRRTTNFRAPFIPYGELRIRTRSAWWVQHDQCFVRPSYENLHKVETVPTLCKCLSDRRMKPRSELRPNYQTSQSWSKLNQDSVNALHISRLKCCQKYNLPCSLVVKCDRLWPGRHVEFRMKNFSAPPTSVHVIHP